MFSCPEGKKEGRYLEVHAAGDCSCRQWSVVVGVVGTKRGLDAASAVFQSWRDWIFRSSSDQLFDTAWYDKICHVHIKALLFGTFWLFVVTVLT